MSKQPSLEQCFAKIEGVIDQLEGDEVTLDQALKQYELALKHVRIARGQLDAFEAKLVELREDEAPTVREASEQYAAADKIDLSETKQNTDDLPESDLFS